jgi:hypothetical protein
VLIAVSSRAVTGEARDVGSWLIVLRTLVRAVKPVEGSRTTVQVIA